ncbi:MAG: FadR family transcriptional regulator [Desulfamplus sp.]|nr:FadR family transcriptional regulator [Desulfamplus sp.]
MSDKVKPEFQKAKKNRIFQDVVDQIQEAILEGKLTPGDVLPPERELRETFNVSRGTLREALRVLEQKGLVEIRLGTGGGARVREAGTEQLTETLAFMIRSGTLPVVDIGEFREGMEAKIASLAALRANEKDIKKLEKMLKNAFEIAQKGESGWQDFLYLDESIHKEIAKIARNSVYQYLMKVVHDNIQRYYIKFLDFSDSRLAENYQDLKNIVSAIKEHRAEEAGRIAEEHVKRFNARMRAKEALTLTHQQNDVKPI